MPQPVASDDPDTVDPATVPHRLHIPAGFSMDDAKTRSWLQRSLSVQTAVHETMIKEGIIPKDGQTWTDATAAHIMTLQTFFQQAVLRPIVHELRPIVQGYIVVPFIS